jgi:hypothetical protein
MPHQPLGDKPMTNAERQARHRAAHAAPRPPRPGPALARCRHRPARPSGRVSGVAPGLARQPSGKRHRRSVASHRRARPRRTPGDRTAQGLRPGLATPPPAPHPRVAQVGKQAPPTRAAASLVRALRDARGSPLFATWTTLSLAARVLFARRSGVPFARRLTGGRDRLAARAAGVLRTAVAGRALDPGCRHHGQAALRPSASGRGGLQPEQARPAPRTSTTAI